MKFYRCFNNSTETNEQKKKRGNLFVEKNEKKNTVMIRPSVLILNMGYLATDFQVENFVSNQLKDKIFLVLLK